MNRAVLIALAFLCAAAIPSLASANPFNALCHVRNVRKQVIVKQNYGRALNYVAPLYYQPVYPVQGHQAGYKSKSEITEEDGYNLGKGFMRAMQEGGFPGLPQREETGVIQQYCGRCHSSGGEGYESFSIDGRWDSERVRKALDGTMLKGMAKRSGLDQSPEDFKTFMETLPKMPQLTAGVEPPPLPRQSD